MTAEKRPALHAKQAEAPRAVLAVPTGQPTQTVRPGSALKEAAGHDVHEVAAVPAFEKLLLEALRSVILADDSISPEETEWIRQFIYADGKVDAAEKHWLKELKCLAGKTCPEFQALYDKCMAS